MLKYVHCSYSSCSKGYLCRGRGEICSWGNNCFAVPRLVPSPVAIDSLGSLELESSEANHFGKVDKAAHFAIIKLCSYLKGQNAEWCWVLTLAQKKSTCPPSAALPSAQSPSVTRCINSGGVPVSGVWWAIMKLCLGKLVLIITEVARRRGIAWTEKSLQLWSKSNVSVAPQAKPGRIFGSVSLSKKN